MEEPRRIAYFSMEIGHTVSMPTYTGGLGVLAGDTLRSAADLRIPMTAVTLLHRKGYFHQTLDSNGQQKEGPVNWNVDDFLEEVRARVSVMIHGRPVQVRAWLYNLLGETGYSIPIYFLDAWLDDNDEKARSLTDHLYGGDGDYRLSQEIILGIAGVRMLRALGYGELRRFHCNEGHAGLLMLELLRERARFMNRTEVSEEDVAAVRRQCIFTTHTPVPAGHDRFPAALVESALEPEAVKTLRQISCLDDFLNMTHLALRLGGFVNGVSERHGEVSRRMFPNHVVESITNGVHATAWVCESFQELFDAHLPGWRRDACALRQALKIPNYLVWGAHMHAKRRLIEFVNRETNVGMDMDHFTIGFARRAATYKRADLLFHDLERLKMLQRGGGPIQVIFAGKAHPHDQQAKELIRRIFHFKDSLKGFIKIAYLQDYDIEICALMTSGVELWLNTPEPPLEASGTSGMKAALNGIPSFSVLDGWWVEGWIEGVTGWVIGKDDLASDAGTDRAATATSLYDKLEYLILPMFYRNRDRFVEIMRHCISINGSFFNTQRMMQQYALKAYFP